MNWIASGLRVGEVEWISVAHTERIRSDKRSYRRPDVCLDYAAELLSRRGPAQNPRSALGVRDVPGVASCKIPRHVEIGGATSNPGVEEKQGGYPVPPSAFYVASRVIDLMSRVRGSKPGALNPLASEVMKEAGIDISGQQPQGVAQSVKERFGYVIAICDTAKERSPIFPFTLHLRHWSIVDPNTAGGVPEQRTDVFRRVCETRLRTGLNNS